MIRNTDFEPPLSEMPAIPARNFILFISLISGLIIKPVLQNKELYSIIIMMIFSIIIIF